MGLISEQQSLPHTLAGARGGGCSIQVLVLDRPGFEYQLHSLPMSAWALAKKLLSKCLSFPH